MGQHAAPVDRVRRTVKPARKIQRAEGGPRARSSATQRAKISPCSHAKVAAGRNTGNAMSGTAGIAEPWANWSYRRQSASVWSPNSTASPCGAWRASRAVERWATLPVKAADADASTRPVATKDDGAADGLNPGTCSVRCTNPSVEANHKATASARISATDWRGTTTKGRDTCNNERSADPDCTRTGSVLWISRPCESITKAHSRTVPIVINCHLDAPYAAHYITNPSVSSSSNDAPHSLFAVFDL
ncbi:hypothetical protein BH10PSE18_BH10PSE18_38660 [soil metagenome]